jgi:hypothetical protein
MLPPVPFEFQPGDLRIDPSVSVAILILAKSAVVRVLASIIVPNATI